MVGNDTDFELTNMLTLVNANEINNDNNRNIIDTILFIEIPKMRFVLNDLSICI